MTQKESPDTGRQPSGRGGEKETRANAFSTLSIPYNYAVIPQEITELLRWVVWRYEDREDGSRTKVPYKPWLVSKGQSPRASSTDPTTWGTFEQAVVFAKLGKHDGIGYVLHEPDQIIGIDLDKCVDGQGQIKPWARAFLQVLNSYTEYSPSGRGLHIFVKGKLPPGLDGLPQGRQKAYQDGKVEMYARARYLTMTGNHLEGTPTTIEKRYGQVQRMYADVFGVDPAPLATRPRAMEPNSVADAELVRRAMSATNGGDFHALWQGDASGYDGDESRADLALCNHLAFWTGRDAARMDHLFRQSGLYRQKWERQDYRELTIAKAVENCTKCYTPSGGPRSPLRISNDEPRRIRAELEPEPLIRPLPDEIAPDPELASQAGARLDTYIRYAQQVSPMTPVLFHEAIGLCLASMVVAGRLKIPMPHDDVYPNLAVALIAPTTIFRKTTALNIGRRIAWREFPHLLTAQDMSVEGFLTDLAGREPSHFDQLTQQEKERFYSERTFAAQRQLTLDELSSLFASAGKDYNQGLIETILRLFDCDTEYSRTTRGQGRITVRNAYLSILGASTPTAMAPHLLSDHLWSMGLWPRFAILTPETRRPEWAEATEAEEPEDVSRTLRTMYRTLGIPTWPTPPTVEAMTLGAGVFKAWGAYNRAMSYDMLTPELDQRLWGLYGRLPTQVLKIGILLAALDWDWTRGANPVLGMRHFARAVLIADKWRASAHRTLSMASTTEMDALKERILRQLSKAEPDGLTKRELGKLMRDVSSPRLLAALIELVDFGEVEEIDVRPEGRGAATTRYRIARDE